MNSPYTQATIRYDVLKHETGTRVIEVGSGRKGLVVEIIETKPEWIEPLVKWDNTPSESPSKAKAMLVLEDYND